MKETHEYYQDGYTCGYEWLTRGWNFKHPHSKGGYIPGGPFFYNKYNRWHKEYARENQQITNNAAAWRKGWIDGINDYVLKNGLPYEEVAYVS